MKRVMIVGSVLCLFAALAYAQPGNPADHSAQESAQEALGRLDGLATAPVRQAIEDLRDTFGARYPRAAEFLNAVQELDLRIADARAAIKRGEAQASERAATLQKDFEQLRYDALMANPLLAAQPLLFVVRPQYKPDHHNTETMFQTGEINTASFTGGGALKAIDFAQGGAVRTLLEAPEGIIRDPDIDFDGKKILIAMRKNIADDYHLYEIGIDGGETKQLTRAAGVTDIDPLYLPDGDIAFSSTREPKYCMCNRHIMCNLYRMERDGANIVQIGKSTLFEGHGALLPDGRILYYRWEYVDRNFGDGQGLWTVNPDGTNHAVYWGNNTNSPGAVIDARIIPGTQQAICTFSSCHDRPWGAIAIIDRRLGLDLRAPVVRTWPASAIDLIGKGDFDTYKQVMPKYEDPWPLSDKYFLCSRMIGHDEIMGIYLLDVFGNEMLLHTEGQGCFDPMPLAAHERPPVIPSRRDFENKDGAFYVADVYRGTHMKGVERGAIKWLRVVESPEKRFWTNPSWNGQGQEAPAMGWHDFNNKRILGTVPVEADGSAYFNAPPDRFLYFQALDENGMMLQSMRSGVIVQSGERTGCIGCHEERRSCPPPPAAVPLALKRAPNILDGWRGPARMFNYRAEVQPVFDKYCVRCHDYGLPAGQKLNLAGDRTTTFNTSYVELWRKHYINAIGAGSSENQPALSWGSHTSKIVDILRKGHKGVQLDPESFDRLITWIDINAPYYPDYASGYQQNLAGRCPLTAQQLNQLASLTGVPFGDLADQAKNTGPQISFDRPELSPCLSGVGEPTTERYQQALDLIRAGQATLAQHADVDAPGFQLEGADAQHETKYEQRRAIEERNRAALCKGERVYDE